eukprot:4884709-Pleurochrysis_carterae.AAC.1
MAMTSSRSAHTSSLQPSPPAPVDGARKPIFHASCREYENWWKKYLKSKRMMRVASRRIRAGSASATILSAASARVGLLSSTQKSE